MLDTKLRNNKIWKVCLSILMLLTVTIGNVYYFTDISKSVKEEYTSTTELNQEIDTGILQSLYKGVYVLYYEQTMQANKDTLKPYQVFVNSELLSIEETDRIDNDFDRVISNLKNNFQGYRYKIDYYATNGIFAESNTSNALNEVLSSSSKHLLEDYRNVWVIKYDEYGQVKIDVLKSEDIALNTLSKELLRISKENYITNHTNIPETSLKSITNFTMIFGISKNSDISLVWYPTYEPYGYTIELIETKALALFSASLGALLVVAILLTRKKANEVVEESKNRNYLFELGLLGIFLSYDWYGWYCDGVYNVYYKELTNIKALLFESFNLRVFVDYLGIIALVFIVFAMFYTIMLILLPIGKMGMEEYLKKYSYIYKKQETIKNYLEKLKEELSKVDFHEHTTKKIIALLGINFGVLFFIILFAAELSWKSGCMLLSVYSVVLFVILKDYIRKIIKDYNTLLDTTKCIAEGQLDISLTDRMGVFEPVANELGKIQVGFKKAVEDEVKSQRMRTELITNVSHDLKTPLTAITTYIELLKKEDITEEERKEYIETLTQKSKRMKILIEDLFEVSKANSETVSLNLMKVDLVKLMKQVAIEHSEKYDSMNIQLCWNCSHDVIELMLDSQKTYRIFENLFLNIGKYAMLNSRVYIDVVMTNGNVTVTIKNISATPITIPSDELTERFVRGDLSRNTEGSGLGLAIAKSFTEIQGGKFELVTDGDLFKTILSWNNVILKS